MILPIVPRLLRWYEPERDRHDRCKHKWSSLLNFFPRRVAIHFHLLMPQNDIQVNTSTSFPSGLTWRLGRK